MIISLLMQNCTSMKASEGLLQECSNGTAISQDTLKLSFLFKDRVLFCRVKITMCYQSRYVILTVAHCLKWISPHGTFQMNMCLFCLETSYLLAKL